MRLKSHRRLLVFLCLVALATQASAQRSTSNPNGQVETAIATMQPCGTQRMIAFDRAKALKNTAERTPDLYRRAVAEAKGTAARLLSDEEQTFWAPDYVAQMWVQIKAVRMHMGRLARVWVDVRDTARADVKSKLPILVKALEDSTSPTSRNPGKGIIENDIEVFGPTPTVVGDGYQDFLLFDITDQNILGFFQPNDQTTDEFSNRRNMLYIDSREGLSRTSSLLNTLAHEFQHLIHQGQNPNSDIFINEGCSEVAGVMCGYTDRRNTNYLRNTNTVMFEWPEDLVGNNLAYERALTFMHYLYEQFGAGFLNKVLRTRGASMSVIDDALNASHPGNPSAAWSVAGRGFAVANWLQSNSDERFAYKVKITSSMQPRAKPLRTYTSSNFRRSDTVSVLPYGAAYLVYDSPPVMSLRIKGRYNYRVLAIGYRGNEVEVMDFEPGKIAVIGSSAEPTGFDRVVLVITELSNATQKITWDVTEGVSGIEDELAASSPTRFISVSPNPVESSSEIAFATAGTGSVRLELFASTGAVVRSIVDAERLESGEHRVAFDATGLAAGMYLARLTEGERTATHLVIIR